MQGIIPKSNDKLKQVLGISGVITALILICALLSGCVLNKPKEDVYSFSGIYFGTIVTGKVYGESGEEEATRIRETLEDTEEHISRRIETSEISKINALASGGKINIDADTAELIYRCLEIGRASDGAFDITLGELIELWNIDALALEDARSIPSDEAIIKALQTADIDGISLEAIPSDAGEGNKTWTLSKSSDTKLDLGAAGKGYAFDKVKAVSDSGKPLMLSLGGSILLVGSKPDGTPWKVGVTDPFVPEEMAGSLTIDDAGDGVCISTSGDYERYITVDGVKYHHILDPKTGYPAENGVRSVTVISHDGVLSDALSTALFVQGYEDGLKLLEKYEDAEALFILDDNSIIMTEGAEKIWQKK